MGLCQRGLCFPGLTSLELQENQGTPDLRPWPPHVPAPSTGATAAGGQWGGTHTRGHHSFWEASPFSALRESMARYPALTRPCLAPAAITARYTGTQEARGMCSSQPSSPTKDRRMARTCRTHSWGQPMGAGPPLWRSFLPLLAWVTSGETL